MRVRFRPAVYGLGTMVTATSVFAAKTFVVFLGGDDIRCTCVKNFEA